MIHTFQKYPPFFNFKNVYVGTHQVVGLTATGGLIMQIIIGIISNKIWQKNFAQTQIKPLPNFVDKLHWWLGRFCFLLSVANVYLAFMFFKPGSSWFFIYGFWCFCIFIFFVVMELNKCTKGKKHHHHPTETQGFLSSGTYDLVN